MLSVSDDAIAGIVGVRLPLQCFVEGLQHGVPFGGGQTSCRGDEVIGGPHRAVELWMTDSNGDQRIEGVPSYVGLLKLTSSPQELIHKYGGLGAQ